MQPCHICGSQPKHQQASGRHRFHCHIYHGKHHYNTPWSTSRHAAREVWNHSQALGAELIRLARLTAPVPRHCEWTLRTGQCGRTATHCDPDTSAWYCQTHARDYEDVFGVVLLLMLGVTQTPPAGMADPP